MSQKTLLSLSFLLLFVPWFLFYQDYLLWGKIYVAPTPHTLIPGIEGTVDIRQSYQRDRSIVLYPEWTFLNFLQKTGAASYWNPYQFSGVPLISFTSYTDPLRFVLVELFGSFFSSDTLYMLAMMLRSAVALTFAFFIFRHFKLNTLWAAAGAAAFWFNASNLILHYRTYSPLYLWAPLLWVNLKLWSAPDTRRRLLWGLGLALLFAAEIYTLHLHFSLLFASLLVVFNAALAFQNYRQGRSRAAIAIALGIFLAAGILAAAIGILRIWTFTDLLGYSYRTVLEKASGGMVIYIPFGILYFPYLYEFQNALTLFTSINLHPIHPELKRVIAEFDNMRLALYLVSKTLGQVNALYRSPLWYLILTFMFLERKTRQQAFPFWASFLLIFCGYNGLALLHPIFSDFLPTTLKAGSWLYIILTAMHSCLAICFGFGMVGLWRILRLCQISARPQAGVRALFAPVTGKAWSRLAIIAGSIVLLGLGTVHTVWSVAHVQIKDALYRLVSAMYNRTAPGFLSNLIRGQYPLAHYYAKVDYLWDALYTVLIYFFLVLVPVILLSIWILRLKRRSGKFSPIRFRLFKVLSAATVFLMGYGVTYILLGMQLNRYAAYVSEKLRMGLIESGLDAQLSHNSSIYFQNMLEGLYNPLPGICFLLLGITALGMGLLWHVASNPHRRTLILPSITLLLGIEGVLVVLNREDHATPQTLSPKAEWIDFLKDRIGHARYLAYGHAWEPEIKTVPLGNGEIQQVYDLSLASLAVKKYGLLKPSVDLLLRMETLEGSSSLVLNDYRIFTYAAQTLSSKGELRWPEMLRGRTEMDYPFYKTRAFDLLSMKYLVTREPISDPDYHLIYDNAVRIYENARAFPRAWLVADYEVIPDRYKLLLRFCEPEFDPARSLLLEKQPVYSAGARTRYGWVPHISGRSGDRITFKEMGARQRWTLTDVPNNEAPFRTSPSPESEVELLSLKPGNIRYRVKTRSGQMLVLSEIFYPGWQARIDGRPADIYRADYALMAVPVESGTHEVELVFDPVSYRKTWRASILALSLAIGALAFLGVWTLAFGLRF